MFKPIQLHWNGRCSHCGRRLRHGLWAYYNIDSRAVYCNGCAENCASDKVLASDLPVISFTDTNLIYRKGV